MWLVDAHNGVHEVLLLFAILVLLTEAWAGHVAECKQTEDVAGQTDKSSDQHVLGIDRDVVMVDNSLSCLHAKPDDHHPDYQHACQSTNDLCSVVSPCHRLFWHLLSDPY